MNPKLPLNLQRNFFEKDHFTKNTKGRLEKIEQFSSNITISFSTTKTSEYFLIPREALGISGTKNGDKFFQPE